MASANITDRASTNIYRGLGQQVDDGDFCDVVVVVEQKEFWCHRAVLASVSTFFKNLLKPNWQENSSKRVEITHEDVSSESFGHLMDILYRGSDLINIRAAKQIFRMSVYLQIDFLKEYCIEFLREKVQPEFCLGTWQFSEKYDLDTVTDTSFKMAVDQIDTVCQHNELLDLPKSMLLILLSEQQKLSLDDVCKAILRWVVADQDKRKIHLLELLPFVCFPLLSSSYQCDLLSYQNQSFRDILLFLSKRDADRISQGLTYRLIDDIKNKQKILGSVSVPLDLPEIQSRGFVIGGYTEINKPSRDTYAFNLNLTYMRLYKLAPLPEDIGLDFASCTWYNEVYVSGGSELSTFFAVYKPGDNEWEVLPSLPDVGLEKHAMVAVSSNIYLLGGLAKNTSGEKTICSRVLKYNTSSREWSVFCQLLLGVQESTAAVLGHRIYLFGGVDSKGARTDWVQCVDTLGGCTYQAGKLPSLTCGARALSNGGRIYVVRPEGDVLSMKENSSLANQVEQKLSATKEESEIGNQVSSTVSLTDAGNFEGRRHFGACLHAGGITVCGGESKAGELLKTFELIPLGKDTMPKKPLNLLAGTAKFDIHVLNVPVEYMKEETAEMKPFVVGDIVTLHPDEEKRLQNIMVNGRRYVGGYNTYPADYAIPVGIGTIKAIDDATQLIRVDFRNYEGWRGFARELLPAP